MTSAVQRTGGMAFGIEVGTAVQAWELACRIAELGGEAEQYGRQVYQRRLSGDSALVLLATADGEPVGFKAGYDRYRDGSWYSWMGGVLEPWRGQGVAQLLLQAQEKWVAEQGYATLYVKTRNRHKRMMAFLAINDYDIIRVEEKSSLAEARILYAKKMPAPDRTT